MRYDDWVNIRREGNAILQTIRRLSKIVETEDFIATLDYLVTSLIDENDSSWADRISWEKTVLAHKHFTFSGNAQYTKPQALFSIYKHQCAELTKFLKG